MLIENCGKPLFLELRPEEFVTPSRATLWLPCCGAKWAGQGTVGSKGPAHAVLLLPVWWDLWTQQSVPEEAQYQSKMVSAQ